MIPVQIRFTKKLIEYIDKLIESGVYSNRSEAIRDATRRLVMDMSSSGGINLQSPAEGSNSGSGELRREVDVR